MNRIKLPIKDIRVLDRQRKDLGDVSRLAESLQNYGLIQPIVINQEQRLVAGERRLRAAEELGWTDIDVVYRETLTEAELTELEIEENIRRKNMTWQERCLSIAKIHFLKVRHSYQEGSKWGQRETGELLDMALGPVNDALTVASELKNDPQSPLWQAENFYGAMCILRDRNIAVAEAELARRQKALANSHAIEAKVIEEIKQSPDALAEERRKYYANPLNPSGSFELYWDTKLRRLQEIKNTVYLYSKFHNCDAISYMQETDQRFSAIITDPPYAIDMAMLDQENVGMENIDSVAAEHDEEENKNLLKRFFPAAYRCLQDKGFLVLCADQMLWNFLYDNAIGAGFAVQRWPLVWVKAHTCMNNAALYNYTKSTEIAIVCRKGGALLTEPISTSHVIAPHDEYKTTMRHPFVKPFKFWEFMTRPCSRMDDLVLEPFAGHGSGVISLLRMGRNVIACESNVEHYNALLENVQRYYTTLNPQFVFK